MNDPIKTIDRIAQRIRKQYSGDAYLTLEFQTLRIRCSADSSNLINSLSEYFRAFVTDTDCYDILISVHEVPDFKLPYQYIVKAPDPGKTKIKEEFLDIADYRIVKKRQTGMYFIFGGETNIAIGPCQKNINQVINFINNRFIAWKLSQGCLLGHAAAVHLKEKGLALAGFSGLGKSTLALKLMNRGLDFVSNDRLLISDMNDRIAMVGVAKHPRINPGTALNNPRLHNILTEEERINYSDLDPEELWTLEHKYDAPIDLCFGKNKFRLHGWMDGLVILNWSRDKGDCVVREVNPAHRHDLVKAFMKAPGLFYNPLPGENLSDLSLSSYVDLLGKCSVLEVSGGVNFDTITDACMAFLER